MSLAPIRRSREVLSAFAAAPRKAAISAPSLGARAAISARIDVSSRVGSRPFPTTGMPATITSRTDDPVSRTKRARRLGLVTPYLDEIQSKITANFAAEGFDIVAERHLRDRGNFSFSEHSEERIAGLIREVAAAKPDAITVFCTNMRGGPVVEALEREIGIPIYDTVATAVWDGLRKDCVPPSRVRGWGRLFADIA